MSLVKGILKVKRSLFMLGSAIAIRVVSDRYLSNHHIAMIEMDKIAKSVRILVELYH
ncbi:hypothetical protein [Argonema antarcticum]|uniref:hypothetical protein n=1 Tax=Argonema antarcticum TaxID=2942763 RepID=UPI0020136B28|nr:hypothetical protein [Argonema antarcticum]MCL1472198.1 hypothetical protein [Argonema antarcticum A004/B2]